MLLRIRAVMERLGLSERHVRLLIAQGRLPAVRIGRAVRVRSEDVDAIVRVGLPRRGERP